MPAESCRRVLQGTVEMSWVRIMQVACALAAAREGMQYALRRLRMQVCQDRPDDFSFGGFQRQARIAPEQSRMG